MSMHTALPLRKHALQQYTSIVSASHLCLQPRCLPSPLTILLHPYIDTCEAFLRSPFLPRSFFSPREELLELLFSNIHMAVTAAPTTRETPPACRIHQASAFQTVLTVSQEMRSNAQHAHALLRRTFSLSSHVGVHWCNI